MSVVFKEISRGFQVFWVQIYVYYESWELDLGFVEEELFFYFNIKYF